MSKAKVKTEIKLTCREWLNRLPFVYKHKAIKNLDHAELKTGQKIGNIEHTTLTDALFGAFDFKESPEGAEYWQKFIVKQLKSN